MHLGVGGTNTQTTAALSLAASSAEQSLGSLPSSGLHNLFLEGRDWETCVHAPVCPPVSMSGIPMSIIMCDVNEDKSGKRNYSLRPQILSKQVRWAYSLPPPFLRVSVALPPTAPPPGEHGSHMTSGG